MIGLSAVNFLKAALIGLLWVPLILWAADSPRVTVDQGPLGANKADIGFTSVINGDNHMDIVITSGNGGKGCSAGQLWDVFVGGCTSPVKLRSLTTSRACDCSCPGKGSCSSSQNGTYPVFGWRLPTAGNELISHNGATTWGACTVVSNSCEAGEGGTGGGDTGDNSGGAPSAGSTFYINALICNSSNSDYYSGSLGDSEKSQIISVYRQFSYGSRCPETAGYVFWLSAWSNWAAEYQSAHPGSSLQTALDNSFLSITLPAMNEAAASNGEADSSQQGKSDAYCSSYASNKFGVPVNASYVYGSGSSCVVN